VFLKNTEKTRKSTFSPNLGNREISKKEEEVCIAKLREQRVGEKMIIVCECCNKQLLCLKH
jgi:hypothetical protein